MGNIPVKGTHVVRSSIMSFAMRWKRENFRQVAVAAILSVVVTTLMLMLLHATAAKKVILVLNGEEKTVYTKQWTLQRLLAEQTLALDNHDRISKPLKAILKNGDRIVIDQTVPVQLIMEGKSDTVYTSGKTVAEVFKDLQIPLNDGDKVEPALDSVISNNTDIKLIRVNKVVEEVSAPIPYKVVKKSDPQLLKGKEQTVQDGAEGELLKKVEKVYEDGQLIAEQVIDESVKRESVNKVVAVGTKNPVVVLSASSPTVDQVIKDGVTFGIKQILNNVTLTAYSAGPDSTGKSQNNPQYGITYSGTRVKEGRTIAVDPKVIPMGWWVYIEGIGFRRAEDIGSGVRGNMIDVYYESEDYAKRFGLKRGYKVYIIGKDKPATN